MKVVISNKAYFKPDDELWDYCCKQTTYHIETMTSKYPKMYKNSGVVAKEVKWIPITRLDLLDAKGIKYELVDKRTLAPVDIPKPSFTLRPEDQQVIHEECNDTCLINGRPGYGKTVQALALTYKFGQKTLVICTNTSIREMWQAEVRKWFGFEPGVIGSGKYNIDPPIVISNIQTVNKHADKLSKVFGTVIVDECLDYKTSIMLADGTRETIGKIVNQKLTPEVMSFNINTNQWEAKKVLRHFKNKQKTLLMLKGEGKTTLRCTENHNLYVLEGGNIIKKQAKDCIAGTELIQFNRHKSRHTIADYSLLLALVIGDGCLQKTAGGIRLGITQGEKQNEWLEYKVKHFNTTIGNTQEGKSGYCNNRVNKYTSATFSDYNNIYEKLYETTAEGNSKKLFHDDLMKLVNWRFWAYLICDDGSFNNGNITISLCEMNTEVIDKIAGVTFSKDQYTVFTCNKGYNYLRLKTNAVKLINNHCEKYIPDSMLYKLGKEVRSVELIEPSPIFYNFSTWIVEEVSEVLATGGNRYNIEVEDNHNYVANGSLVANCHHCVATTFTNFLEISCARYKIGLSGTLKRKDGLNVMFKDYFGYKIFSPPVNNTINPTIHRYSIPVELSGNQNVPWALRANDVYNHPEYREAVINMADLYSKIGHKVLFVSDRTELIQAVLEALNQRGVKTYEIIGATPLEDRLRIQKEVAEGGACVLGAAQSIFSEGISLNELSCLILGSLINNESLIEQLAGRVQRIAEGKLDPIVIDFIMKGSTGIRQAAGRMAVYRNNGWETITMTPEKAVKLAEIVFGKSP